MKHFFYIKEDVDLTLVCPRKQNVVAHKMIIQKETHSINHSEMYLLLLLKLLWYI